MKTKIENPAWAFHPDQWSEVFLQGLNKILHEWDGKSVWEVGVGTGNNIIELYDRAQAFKWYFSDLNPNCTLLAHENILDSVGFTSGNLFPLHGEWDLVIPPSENYVEAPKVDIIFGCIPQIPNETNLFKGDNMAHYYDFQKYIDSNLNILGLALNESLLKRARNLVNDYIVLNLSGRPGLASLRTMFEQCGYKPHVVHQSMVSQHAGTSLAPLVLLEEQGINEFEFFSDQEGKNRISVAEAEILRINNRNIYHMMYVIKGLVT